MNPFHQQVGSDQYLFAGVFQYGSVIADSVVGFRIFSWMSWVRCLMRPNSPSVDISVLFPSCMVLCSINQFSHDGCHAGLCFVGSFLNFLVRYFYDFPSTPKSVMTEMPNTLMPQWLATMTSGTVDMPTASAPRIRNILYSAGVRK